MTGISGGPKGLNALYGGATGLRLAETTRGGTALYRTGKSAPSEEAPAFLSSGLTVCEPRVAMCQPKP